MVLESVFVGLDDFPARSSARMRNLPQTPTSRALPAWKDALGPNLVRNGSPFEAVHPDGAGIYNEETNNVSPTNRPCSNVDAVWRAMTTLGWYKP